jgi:hypothetical protein
VLALALILSAQVASPALASPADEELPATRLIYLPGRFQYQCPGEVEVQEGITRRLGRTPFAEPPTRIVVLALEGETEAPERARSELFDDKMESLGARVIESSDGCSELVEAAELAISIALAPSLALAVAPPEPAPIEPRPVAEPLVVETPVVEAPVVEGEAPAEPEPYMSWMPAGSRLRFGGGSHAHFLFGPQEAVGWQLTVAMEVGPWEVGLEQRNDFPRWDDSLDVLHGGGVNTLLACGQWDWFGDGDGGSIGVLGCASGSSGSVWSLGDVTGVVPYAGVGGRVAASWTAWDHDVLRVWTQVEWSVVRPSFAAFSSQAGLWEQTSPVSVTLGLTYEVSWP